MQAAKEILHLDRRTVTEVRPRLDGIGYDVTCDCNHTTFWATDPGPKAYCGVCLDEFIDRFHKLRSGRL